MKTICKVISGLINSGFSLICFGNRAPVDATFWFLVHLVVIIIFIRRCEWQSAVPGAFSVSLMKKPTREHLHTKSLHGGCVCHSRYVCVSEIYTGLRTALLSTAHLLLALRESSSLGFIVLLLTFNYEGITHPKRVKEFRKHTPNSVNAVQQSAALTPMKGFVWGEILDWWRFCWKGHAGAMATHCTTPPSVGVEEAAGVEGLFWELQGLESNSFLHICLRETKMPCRGHQELLLPPFAPPLYHSDFTNTPSPNISQAWNNPPFSPRIPGKSLWILIALLRGAGGQSEQPNLVKATYKWNFDVTDERIIPRWHSEGDLLPRLPSSFTNGLFSIDCCTVQNGPHGNIEMWTVSGIICWRIYPRELANLSAVIMW